MLYQSEFITRLEAGLRSVLPAWGLSDATEVSLLTVSENATFLARDPARPAPVVLRVHRPNYHTRDEIASELAWIEALRDAGSVETPALIPTTAGGYITAFEDGSETRHVVGFAFMEGSEPDADAGLIPGFVTLGEISARLHQHTERWQRPPGFTRKTWDFETAFGPAPHWGLWRDALGLTPAGADTLQSALDRLATRLDAYGKASDRFGLVHADLRLANLLARADGLGVIDFDDCGYSWFMYDFAAAISFLELAPIVPDLQAAWLDGYQRVRALGADDIAMLPDFILFRRILLTAWIASHRETETAHDAGLEAYTDGTVRLARTYLAAT
ncbi:phosphotransferase [uncultured Roseobacter sp.]|uniref:phosphotransferase enzyme family protein n=1 Tax=uncultured Roseobacter sp. TaxID=114847 RepID=UPI002607DE0A|nr:phosphotransferase [uncultured Roseobacter sp.]